MPCGCALLAYIGLSVLNSPATVEFQLEHWENKSFGFHDIDRQRIWGTVAESGDGSRSNNIGGTYYRYYFARNGQFSAHAIYLRPSNIAYEVDDAAKTATTCLFGPTSPVSPRRSFSRHRPVMLSMKVHASVNLANKNGTKSHTNPLHSARGAATMWILKFMDHALVQAALRVLKCAADREPPSPEDIELLRSRVVDPDPNARHDDLACQVIRNELAKSRKRDALSATA
jgi:hypothetical protein